MSVTKAVKEVKEVWNDYWKDDVLSVSVSVADTKMATAKKPRPATAEEQDPGSDHRHPYNTTRSTTPTNAPPRITHPDNNSQIDMSDPAELVPRDEDDGNPEPTDEFGQGKSSNEIPGSYPRRVLRHMSRPSRVTEADYQKLKDERNHQARVEKSLIVANQNLHATIQDREREIKNMRYELDRALRQTNDLEKAKRGLSKAKKHLEMDNEKLRWVIANQSSARQPLRDEAYYKTEFDVLNGKIQNWAAAQSKKAKLEDFTTTSQQFILTQVSKLQDASGIESAELVKTYLATLYGTRPTRIVLIRHLISLYLYATVLKLYAFGFDEEWSAYFENIEDRFLNRGFAFIPTTDSTRPRLLYPLDNSTSSRNVSSGSAKNESRRN